MGGSNGEKGEGLSGNMHKGHMDKTKRGVGSRVECEDGWSEGEWWRENGDNCT